MANVNDPESIHSAIRNLSSKRNVISEEALKAKRDLDEQRTAAAASRQEETDKKWNKKLTIIEEFNDSVALLMSIFQNSQFDELAMFATSPARVLLINFFIGVLRGIGFAVGFLLMVLIALIMIKQALPHDFLIRLVVLLRHLF
ncbi:hypothetical protein EBR96_05345 [bacterium]|nr:hypothetical protein [bacterium]